MAGLDHRRVALSTIPMGEKCLDLNMSVQANMMDTNRPTWTKFSFINNVSSMMGKPRTGAGVYLCRRRIIKTLPWPLKRWGARGSLSIPSHSLWQICEAFCSYRCGQTMDTESSAKPNAPSTQALGAVWPHVEIRGMDFSLWGMLHSLHSGWMSFGLATNETLISRQSLQAQGIKRVNKAKWKTTLPSSVS